MIRIDDETLSRLSAEAASSERLRMNLDLRDSASDSSQRMLNAMEPGTVLPVHRHRTSSETVIIIRGAVEECLYDESGKITERVVLRQGSGITGLSIPAGQWHSTVSLEPGTVIFEAKDGPYAPLTDEDLMRL